MRDLLINPCNVGRARWNRDQIVPELPEMRHARRFAGTVGARRYGPRRRGLAALLLSQRSHGWLIRTALDRLRYCDAVIFVRSSLTQHSRVPIGRVQNPRSQRHRHCVKNIAQHRSGLFPIPPITEQAAIADFLDRETAKIDAMVAKIETAIDRLQEYRTALITAAVTGKIDVRAKTPAA